MIIERLIYGSKIKELKENLSVTNVLRIIVTFCIVSFAWIFFRSENLSDAWNIIYRIFTNKGSLFLDASTLSMAFLAFAMVFIYDLSNEYKIRIKLLNSRYKVVRFATAAFLICYILGFGVLNNSSFIYFQF